MPTDDTTTVVYGVFNELILRKLTVQHVPI